ncbi:hypothetical protein [Nocardioides mangrovi]|uniref:DUF4267 domain-containing protein n=1 Tax=Nocardioides mangrovi TaxID=2874580 RepID=A0ABS7UFY6_9ACTN|nr:hypothetical protein [Nocardioides mangrovi]MBZ5739943.1 hypothetical protein [Nocardioides mangrovi]
MNPVIGLSLGRIAVGAAAVAVPEMVTKNLGVDPVANPQASYVTRLFGVREIAIGLATLTTGGKSRKGVIGIGVLVDAGDAAASYLAMQEGQISKKAALTLLGPAVGAVGSGLLALVRRG